MTFSVPVNALSCPLPEVARLLGYPGEPPPEVRDTLDTLWQQARATLDPMCGYRWFPEGVTVERGCFYCQEKVFHCGALITRHLTDSTGLALFAATLGPAFEAWSKAFFADQADPYHGYLSDAIGSVAVEAVVDWLEVRLQTELDRYALKRTNRLSPGYCNWSVSEQHKLFSLLPKGFCGIRLTDSSLMIPIKSISGVMGIGPEVQRRDYACKGCTMEHCIMRRS